MVDVEGEEGDAKFVFRGESKPDPDAVPDAPPVDLAQSAGESS